MDYLVTNCLITAISLLTYGLLKNAPARLRFYSVTIALISWFIPWQQVATVKVLSDTSKPFTNAMFSLPQFIFYGSAQSSPQNLPPLSIISPQSDGSWLSMLSASNLWGLLVSVGLLLFVVKVYAYLRLMRDCRIHAKNVSHLWQQYQLDAGSVFLYVTRNCDMAMATGIRKSEVWLSEALLDTPELKSVLAHELTHVRQHDPVWMWFITFAHCVFWWNPLVRLLVYLARRNIELSCDERCQEQLSHDYTRDLAKLFLQHQTNAVYSVMPLSHFRNFNIYRIKHLSKETKMKTKYIVVSIFGLTLSSLAAATISETASMTNANQAQSTTKETGKKLAIFNGNVLHDNQVNELITILDGAKSNDSKILNDTYSDLLNWYENRSDTEDPKSEYSLKVISFTMMSYLLEKLQRPQEILSRYDDIFNGEPLERVIFLQHHRAIALMELNSTSEAIDLLEQVISLQPKPKPGSLLMLAQAYLQNNDGANVIRIANKIEELGSQSHLEMLAINYKRAGYEAMGNMQKAAEMRQVLTERFERTSWAPAPMRMSSPLLAYLPESV
jgi:beta-lactamase regulating signal transducer with metallopeptidase domain